jgi:hypothetical protein
MGQEEEWRVKELLAGAGSRGWGGRGLVVVAVEKRGWRQTWVPGSLQSRGSTGRCGDTEDWLDPVWLRELSSSGSIPQPSLAPDLVQGAIFRDLGVYWKD